MCNNSLPLIPKLDNLDFQEGMNILNNESILCYGIPSSEYKDDKYTYTCAS